VFQNSSWTNPPFCFLPLVLWLLASNGLAADGDLDPSFGQDGRLLFAGEGFATDEFRDILVQPDGKIVSFGFTFSDSLDVKVARFTDNGEFDSDFGVGGTQVYDFGADEIATAGLLLSDGKYFITGERRVSNESEILLMRIHADGTPDADFGTDGMQTISGGFANDILRLPDGRIIVGASVAGSADQDFALVGLTASGSLDSDFASEGILTVDFGAIDELRRLALTLDGRILAAGLSDTGNLLICAVSPDGLLDSGFGQDGKVILTSSELGAPLGGRSTVADVSQSVGLAVRLDGKILVGSGGSFGSNGNLDFILVRLEGNGELDSSFGEAGVSTTDLSGENDVLADLANQPDGKIVAVGTVFDSDFPFDPFGNVLVQRYNPDGTPDLSFGMQGWIMTDILDGSGEADAGRSVVIQPDGKILVGGYGPDEEADATDATLVRYLSSFDVREALQLLLNSFETLSPPFPNLANLAESAERQIDRGHRRAAFNVLTALRKQVRHFASLERLAPEYARRVLDLLSVIRMNVCETCQEFRYRLRDAGRFDSIPVRQDR